MWVKLKELPTWTGRQQFKTETRGKKFFNVTPFIGCGHPYFRMPSKHTDLPV